MKDEGLLRSMGVPPLWRWALTTPLGKLLIILPVLAACGREAPTATDLVDAGFFRETSRMAVTRVGHSAFLLPDGRVLILGGSSEDARTEVFDPATRIFSIVGRITVPRSYATAVVLGSGKVLIAGGSNRAEGTLESAEAYDPLGGSSAAVGAMSIPRVLHTATLLQDGRVLIAGGQTPNPEGGSRPLRTSVAEIYDPASQTFAVTGRMVVPRDQHTSTLLPDGKVLITGGQTGEPFASELGNTAELFDPLTGVFSLVGPMVDGGREHVVTPLPNGRLLITGTVRNCQFYDHGSRSFTLGLRMLDARQQHTATLLHDGRVLLAGGNHGEPGFRRVELYDPIGGIFVPTGKLTTERRGHTATLLLDGTVLLTGGASTDGLLNSAEMYIPSYMDAP